MNHEDLEHIYDLIARNGMPEVLRAVAWHQEAHTVRAVPARSPSAPTVPVSPLSEYTAAEQEQIDQAKRPKHRVYGPREEA
jgi:hypothetical protein